MAEPTRERVEAYEKGLGCRNGTWPGIAHNHFREITNPDGCPVAVAAARVEAERVAEVEESARQQTQRLSQHFRELENGINLAAAHALKVEAERDALTASLDRVRVILDGWREEGEIRDALYAALSN